jgi:drug/metabolite transporter (DMT)-like permease
MLLFIGVAVGRTDAALIPLHHFDSTTIIWFDVELVVLLALVGQVLQSLALRTLNIAVAVALITYGSIAAGLVGSIALLGETLTAGELVAGALLLLALALSLIPPADISRIFRSFGSVRRG